MRLILSLLQHQLKKRSKMTTAEGNTLNYVFQHSSILLSVNISSRVYKRESFRNLSENFHLYRYIQCVQFGNEYCKHKIYLYMKLY